MKIAVIGGGAAGLATAWLLESQHEVTLFEQDDRLGGHADTVQIDVEGRMLRVDAGFQFFGAGAAYATFNRLLDALGVTRRTYPATLTVYRHGPGRQRPVVLPPFRRRAPVWASLTPRAIADALRFRRFLAAVPAFLEQRDTTVTIADYIDRQNLPAAFTDRFLYPALLAFWCVDLGEFRGFAAYNALYYLGANLPAGMRAPDQSAVPGGLGVYIGAIVRDLERTSILLASPVIEIGRAGEGFAVQDAAGTRHAFDQVVIATNATQALGMISGLSELAPVAAQLARFEYFDTTIAIHGDRRLMPRRESEWSVVNARWDGEHSSLSVWDPASPHPIFKSWVTYDDRMPEPLYATASYRHGKITPAYFDAQAALKTLQGMHGVWLAGLYTHDADSHESAIRSAVTIARELSPGSERLRVLEG